MNISAVGGGADLLATGSPRPGAVAAAVALDSLESADQQAEQAMAAISSGTVDGTTVDTYA